MSGLDALKDTLEVTPAFPATLGVLVTLGVLDCLATLERSSFIVLLLLPQEVEFKQTRTLWVSSQNPKKRIYEENFLHKS